MNVSMEDAAIELPEDFSTYHCCMFCYAIVKRFMRRSVLDYAEAESTLGNHRGNLTVYSGHGV